MICPECNAEFREGFYTCSDCNVALVSPEAAAAGSPSAGWSSESPDGPFHTTRDSGFLALLVDALETAGIPYAFEAGTALDLLVGGEADDQPGRWEARVQVHRSHRQRAREILEEIESRPPEDPVSE